MQLVYMYIYSMLEVRVIML